MRPNRTEENSATKGLLFAIRGAEFKVNRNPNVDELIVSDIRITFCNPACLEHAIPNILMAVLLLLLSSIFEGCRKFAFSTGLAFGCGIDCVQVF